MRSFTGYIRLREAGGSVQGTLFQAIMRIDNIRYITNVSGKDDTITFDWSGKTVTITGVAHERRSTVFTYSAIFGIEYPFTAQIIDILDKEDIRFAP
jgi:hypothetical protein